jgi:fused signal recognition particle receptor
MRVWLFLLPSPRLWVLCYNLPFDFGEHLFMGFFWRRNKEKYTTLGLNDLGPAQPQEPTPAPPPVEETLPARAVTDAPPAVMPLPADEPPAPSWQPPPAPVVAEVAPATIAPPTPTPPAPVVEVKPSAPVAPPVAEVVTATPAPVMREPPPAPRSSFSSSILGLDLSMEELQAREAALEQEFSARFRKAVAKTRDSLGGSLDNIFQSRKKIDDELLDALEEALISADIGVATTMDILDKVRRGVSREQIKDLDALKQAIKDELLRILRASEKSGVASELAVEAAVKPYVMMIVGVNGVGKTTTIGKLASRIKAEGNDILICAADTFRAAASDQLEIWANRAGVPLIQQKQGTDPAAVLFDSLKSAKARNADVLIVDTAGRLHNKSNLMAELEKMKRVAGREVPGAPHETLLVVDAVTGQNGLEQARQFLKVAGITGLVLTKLDGTAKGGIAVAIAKELNLPIRYVGIGEQVDDLVVFDPEQYVNGLFN